MKRHTPRPTYGTLYPPGVTPDSAPPPSNDSALPHDTPPTTAERVVGCLLGTLLAAVTLALCAVTLGGVILFFLPRS